MLTLIQKTRSATVPIDGKPRYLRVTYGFDTSFAQRSHQSPRFTITASVWARKSSFTRGSDSMMGGCLHDEIARAFPSLRPLIRWHLTAADGPPMHYSANAVYWAQTALGLSEYKTSFSDPDPLEAFKHTVVFGALEGDELPACLRAPRWILEGDTVKALLRAEIKAEIELWCQERAAALNAAFVADMIAAGLMIEAPVSAVSE